MSVKPRKATFRVKRLPEVISITGLARSTIYQRMAAGTFPKQINLGCRSVGWLESDINNWFDEQIKTRDQEAA